MSVLPLQIEPRYANHLQQLQRPVLCHILLHEIFVCLRDFTRQLAAAGRELAPLAALQSDTTHGHYFARRTRDEALAGFFNICRAQLALFAGDWPVVIPSGSCAGMFRHHYFELFKDEPGTLQQVASLSARTFELAEFLLEVCKVRFEHTGAPVRLALHTSCSARREMNTHLHGRALLAQLAGVERVEHEHESECCGFGGSFSVRMPEISGAMVQDKTAALKGSGAAEVVSADCGCLLNINGCFEKQGDTLRGEHLASFLLRRTTSASTGGVR